MTTKWSHSIGLVLWGILILAYVPSPLWAQGGIGGPYEPDEHTVVLMHFDGDLTNAAGKTADGTGHGTYSFFPSLEGFGQCLYLKNDARSDSSFITIPDTSTLDITGSFTLECWVCFLTFGESAADWRWAPRMFAKAGDDAFYFPNYWLMAWGDRRLISAGYYAGNWVWVDRFTPEGSIEPGKWYHVTFIYDTTATPHHTVLALHDENGTLLFMETYDLDPITEEPPITTNQPLFIGYGGWGSTDSWLDGFIDEIRISNIARVIPLPPIISSTTELENTTDTEGPYIVQTKVTDETEVVSVTLKYEVGAGWTEVEMSPIGGDFYQAGIPGQPPGTTIKYYIEAVDNDGNISTDPPTAPEAFYSFAILQAKALVFYMDFEEGGGNPQDKGPYGLDGIIHGGVSYSTDAKVGSYALAFNATDSGYVEVPHSPFLNMKQFTVELWFKPNALVDNLRLISKQGGVQYAWYQPNYEIKTTSAGFIEVGSYLEPGGWNNFFSDSTLTIGQWYHVAYVFDGGYATIYILDAEDNLIEKKSVPQTGGMPIFTQGPLRVGHAGPAWEPYYDGLMDEIKIYNYAKSFEKQLLGGPYTPDDHTVLLLHFEGNYVDNSGTVPEGTPSNENVGFASSLPGFGQALKLDNSTADKQAYITYPDVEALDITGPFSIEAWFKITSKGESWQTDPRILAKRGDPWWTPNYWLQVAGDNAFSAGYYAGNWVWVDRRDDGTNFQLNQWYHFYFYFDGEDSTYTAVHDSSWNLIWEDRYAVAENEKPPIPTDFPLYIGFGGGGADSWLDGYIDEVRIQSYPPTAVSSEDINVALPDHYELTQNYPNPFNPITEIHYALPKKGAVTLTIFNLLGQRVRRLVDKVQEPGFYSVSWDGKNDEGQNVASGVYFYQIKAGKFVSTKKMVLMR